VHLQDGAALHLDIFQLLDIAEMAINQRRVGELPEMLTGL